MKNKLLALIGFAMLALSFPAGVQAQTWSNPYLGGYMGVNYNGVADTYNAGYSMYVALLGRPQYAYYSPSFEASLQIGTWMGPQCNPGIYCDIEGGPGVGGGYGNHWCNTGFGIGAVAGDGFTNFVNGSASGRGVGVYGGAQISPNLLYPPRMEMFRNGTSGQFLGYGYLALPLLPGKATTDGVNVPTGNRWWTLFFNCRNFQGPVTVITPHFYSEVTKDNTNAAGKMLDSCWAGPNKSIANESHYVPAREYDGPEGSFMRVEPVFSAINHGTNGSLALNSPIAYDQTALWNAAQQWFTNNGPAPVGPFNAQGAALQTLTGGNFGWGINGSPLGGLPMTMGTTMGFYTPDSATLGYKWGTNQVSYTQFANGTPAVAMPEYYKLQGGAWTPVSAAAVPAAAQLASASFDSGAPPAIPGIYTAPNDPVWSSPGPAAGPFQARLDDGNVVTYYWYRFEDQPAIMKAGLTQAERDQLQAEVVKIHSAWTNGGTYLAPPTMGTLVDVDPALLVTPPAGMEVGYVPIATREEWGGWVTNMWNTAASGNWSVTNNWTGTNFPAAGGHSYYRLNFASGTYSATNDQSNGYGYGGFAVNQLNFSGAVTLTGNPVTLTADVGNYPQINQNSGNAVVINTPLNLDVSTVLGGTGSGLVVISNVISGPWHTLTINSPATWRICGLAPNTYSGGTLIKSGTVIWGATTNGNSPDCSYALGTGPVTLNSGATLQFERASPNNALTLNGGTLYAANSAGVTWLGPVTLNSNATVRTDFGMGISGNISGARGLTKTGTNTLTLSGVNTYTGDNVVQVGTLACSTSASLTAGALSISNGATVNLNYSGTRSIFSLTLGGTNKLAGVYGSSSSPATYQDAHFSGTGTVTVPLPISISNLPATGIATNQATLNANLGLTLAYAGTNATVLAYWGTVNGGTNPAAWANSAYVGKWTNVVSANIAYTATGLAMNTNTTYYFTFLATNAAYTVWATNVLSFTTPTKLAFTSVPVFPPAGYPFSVTVQAQDASGNPQSVLSATTVQLSKNSGSGTLSGTVSGTIVNGSGSVVISGIIYSAADTMTLTATAISGMSLTAAVSPPITFMPPNLTWDANGTGAGVSDGGGDWINTSNAWWNGTNNLNWADSYNARFGSGGAGGTITFGTVTANLVTFTNFSGTYTLTSGSLMVVSNLTVANSAGTVVLAYIIGGPGRVTMDSSGSLFVYGLSPNTYSGGTIINRGTLIWGTLVNGSSPDCNYALGTGPVTLNSGGTLELQRVTSTNALTLNGGTFRSQNGWGSTWQGPVTLNSNTTVQASYSAAISGNISGAGGITKTGGDTLTLSGANTYTGANVVQSGALTCSQSASLGSGPLNISNGALVNLNYGGTQTILALKLGGTNMPSGVYGSTSSSATYKDSHFSGTGTVTVQVPISISNLPATGIATNQTTLNASLGMTLSYGGTNATVLAYWGTVNGGTNPAAWTNSAYVSSWTNVATTNLSYTATGLSPGTTYYFTFRGTNAATDLWATNVLSFTTQQPPTKLAFSAVPVNPPAGYSFSVTVQAQDANGKPQTVTNNTTVQLSKNSGSGTLSGTVSGTIVTGSSSVVISGIMYSAMDTMTLTATAISGMSLTAATSPPITFVLPDLTWDANGTGAGVADGGGDWINSSNTWWNSATNLNWTDNNNVRIGSGGAGGTIVLGTVSPKNVTFTNFTGTYTLTNGPLTVVSNLTVANSAGTVTLASVIGGAGGVTMNSTGALRIYGLSPNSYSGGTIINSGTLFWGAFTNGISPDCSSALGTGLVTLNSGATLQFERASPTNALTLNGGTFYSQNGWGVTWQGTVIVNSNTTLQAAWSLGFTGNISGSGGFTKTGSATLTLSGVNTYTGANLVQAGTLTCSQAASLGSGALSISDGAFVNLNYTGTRNIAALTLGGTNMAPGVYGSTSSPATYKDAHFSGTGTVTVPPALITITNAPASAITSSAAAINATLACSVTNAAVLTYWNTVNGGTNAALWTNSAYVGAWTNVVSTNLNYTASGLAPNTTYYFTFRGTNSGGNVWATNVQSFTTLAPLMPPVLLGSAITVTGGVPAFTFATVAGYKYRLTYKNGLMDAVWQAVIAPPNFPLPNGWSATSAGSPMSLSDTNSVSQPQRFYRFEADVP